LIDKAFLRSLIKDKRAFIEDGPRLQQEFLMSSNSSTAGHDRNRRNVSRMGKIVFKKFDLNGI